MRVFLCLLIPLAAITCTSKSRTPTGAGLVTRTLVHDGRERVYHVYAPPGHDPDRPVPLVLALHGGGGRGEKFDGLAKGHMKDQADAHGWVVVYPEGIKHGWNDGRKKSTTAREQEIASVDDVGFLSALIDQMHKDFGIDLDRVYATGISNGGFMSMRLATDLADKVTAVACVASQLAKHQEDAQPSRAVGVLIINGTEDPLVPYYGGQVTVLGKTRGEILSTDDTIAWWVKHNDCKADKVEYTLPNTDEEDSTTTAVVKYAPCAERTSVILYRVVGGGHTWPGGLQYLPKGTVGRTSRDFDAAEHIFDFFETQTRSAR